MKPQKTTEEKILATLGEIRLVLMLLFALSLAGVLLRFVGL